MSDGILAHVEVFLRGVALVFEVRIERCVAFLPLHPAFTVLGNDDSQIVGQQRSCLTERPVSIFLSASVSDPEE